MSPIWLALAIVGLTAQDEPDFSGRWVLDTPSLASPDVPRVLAVRQTLVRTTVTGRPMEPYYKDLVVEREFDSGVRSRSYVIGAVGGVVPGVDRLGRPTDPSASERRFSVRWDADRLVIEEASYALPKSETRAFTEHTEVWSLDESGRLVMSVTERSSEAAPVTRTLTYLRR